MKVFISGAISSRPDTYQRAFCDASFMLRSRYGYTVLDPSILPQSKNISQDEYLHITFAMIDICDAVYFLDGWEQSAGATEEMAYAEQKGKFIIYEDKNK